MTDETNSLEELKKHTEECGKTAENKSACCVNWKKLSNLQMFLLGIGALVVILAVLGLVFEVRAVHKLSQNKMVVSVAKVLHLSAAKINGDRVTYGDYVDDLQTLNKFYSKNASAQRPTDEQISDQVISRLLANKLITKLANDFKAKVQPSDLDTFKQSLLAKFKTEEAAEKELQDNYGWTMSQYIEKVVNPILLEQNLQKAFESSTDPNFDKYMGDQVHARHILFMVTDPKDDAKVKAQAQSVLDQIKKGADFTAMAAKYGSDATKDQGGDLGWFGKGQMVAEFEAAVFALKPGELDNKLVKTQYGYHIVKVDEAKKIKDYAKFMSDNLRQAKIDFILPIHNPFAQLQAPLENTVSSTN